MIRRTVFEFREFLAQGNLIALAVAFVMGAAFGALVNSLVTDLITPIIAAVAGEPNFDDLTFTINDSEFRYGNFLNALITFASIAAAIFFLVLKPARTMGLVPEPPDTKDCPRCASSIPAKATRCPQCTSELG